MDFRFTTTLYDDNMEANMYALYGIDLDEMYAAYMDADDESEPTTPLRIRVPLDDEDWDDEDPEEYEDDDSDVSDYLDYLEYYADF